MSVDVVAVETFTEGRLNRDDDETERQLAAALAAARSYCGWHVSPTNTEQVLTLDGPGAELLVLPTLALSAITACTEDGVAVPTATLEWSARGLVRKPDRRLWTAKFRGIVITITHGFATAADFDAVILTSIDRGAFASGSDTLARVIGPFQYDSTDAAAGAVFTDDERAILDRYALEKTA